MEIPKNVIKNGKRYNFIKAYNNLFLYENEKTKAKEMFSKSDLKLVDNTKIDKVLNIEQRENKFIVYDREEEKEYLCKSQKEISVKFKINMNLICRSIKNKKWIKKRYFIQYMNR